MNGGTVCGSTNESRACNENPCPVHCVVDDWASWGACSLSCGIGTHSRTRNVTTEPLHNGTVCPHLKETDDCEGFKCSRDCVVSAWSSWGSCTKSCSGGIRERSRDVEHEAEW